MARTKKSEATATEAVQEAQKRPQNVGEQQGVPQDTQGQETAQEAAETAQEGAVPREVIGPENPADLLGCQDEDADGAELMEGLLIEYAVSGCKRLNLREEPSLDAPIVAELPCGVGVLGDTRPVEDGWRQVFTGRLFGWVRDQYLEPLELPEQDDDTD